MSADEAVYIFYVTFYACLQKDIDVHQSKGTL